MRSISSRKRSKRLTLRSSGQASQIKQVTERGEARKLTRGTEIEVSTIDRGDFTHRCDKFKWLK
jgi:hypothetical protein